MDIFKQHMAIHTIMIILSLSFKPYASQNQFTGTATIAVNQNLVKTVNCKLLIAILSNLQFNDP